MPVEQFAWRGLVVPQDSFIWTRFSTGGQPVQGTCFPGFSLVVDVLLGGLGGVLQASFRYENGTAEA